jgi:hypothetical protein
LVVSDMLKKVNRSSKCKSNQKSVTSIGSSFWRPAMQTGETRVLPTQDFGGHRPPLQRERFGWQPKPTGSRGESVL